MEKNFASHALHPRDRLPKITPRINLEPERFFISTEEFKRRLEEIFRDLGRIKAFSLFTINNFSKMKQHRLVAGDVKVFAELLNNFLEKEFTDPKKMFESVCNQFQFEFLIMYDLNRE